MDNIRPEVFDSLVKSGKNSNISSAFSYNETDINAKFQNFTSNSVSLRSFPPVARVSIQKRIFKSAF